MKYKVLIPTSGTGSRLKGLTANTNKSLIKVGGREALRYIVESYKPDIPLVVTLGYFGDQVKSFLTQNYPDRVFEFVLVDKYDGPGSSLGYSMLQAKPNLQCPFIFHACDGIFVEKIPAPEHNWIGGFVDNWVTTDLPLEHYRSHTMEDGRVLHFNEKGISGFDSLHIGLDGIKDYKIWWKALEDIYNKNPGDAQISDVPILEAMLLLGVEFDRIAYKVWLDTGNSAALARTDAYLTANQTILN